MQGRYHKQPRSDHSGCVSRGSNHHRTCSLPHRAQEEPTGLRVCVMMRCDERTGGEHRAQNLYHAISKKDWRAAGEKIKYWRPLKFKRFHFCLVFNVTLKFPYYYASGCNEYYFIAMARNSFSHLINVGGNR